MLLLALVLLAAPEDLASRLRHLESAGSAEAPASSPDGSRIAFVTTLFGTRQAASMASEGGYPNQLTDEPGGVIALRYAPNDPKVLIALSAARGEVIVPGDGGARFRLPRFSPDGRAVFVLTDAGRTTMGVDTITLLGRVRKTLYAPPQNLEAYAISEDGHRLAVGAEQEGET